MFIDALSDRVISERAFVCGLNMFVQIKVQVLTLLFALCCAKMSALRGQKSVLKGDYYDESMLFEFYF